ncbi:MAG: N-acetylmuramic acid 6-phosphate etherase [Rhodobacter sp.]|nr:N-acetylmuramic acid 6-phosphate etherase [Rhodobacter sp.]
MQTEDVHDKARGLDARPDAEVLGILLDGQIAALQAVRAALPEIAAGAEVMAETLRGGGRLVYAGAGSSALMGNADGLELAGTFGIDPDRVRLCMAGGLPRDAALPGDTEDDAAQAETDAVALRPGDAVIAVTASGRTPYAVRFAEIAAATGARVIAIANNPAAEIFARADVAICLATPAEVIAGSTRMGAGTAQKAALNLMSTLMGIKLGHVHDGMMVDVRADNAKLRARAVAMVMRIAGVGEAQAQAALAASGWRVKEAVLRCAGVSDPAEVLARYGGRLRPALIELQSPAPAGT